MAGRYQKVWPAARGSTFNMDSFWKVSRVCSLQCYHGGLIRTFVAWNSVGTRAPGQLLKYKLHVKVLASMLNGSD